MIQRALEYATVVDCSAVRKADVCFCRRHAAPPIVPWRPHLTPCPLRPLPLGFRQSRIVGPPCPFPPLFPLSPLPGLRKLSQLGMGAVDASHASRGLTSSGPLAPTLLSLASLALGARALAEYYSHDDVGGVDTHDLEQPQNGGETCASASLSRRSKTDPMR